MAPRKHVIEFVDMHDLGDMLVESGFEIPVMDQETLTITYKSPESLLADVRRWGAYPFERERHFECRRAQRCTRLCWRRSKPAGAPTARSR